MITRESQITTQIVLNNQPNSNTTKHLPYVAYMSLQLLKKLHITTVLNKFYCYIMIIIIDNNNVILLLI